MGNSGTWNSSKTNSNMCKQVDMGVDMYIERKYSMGRMLGKGGSSKVLECTETATGKRFAIKMITKNDVRNKAYFEKEIKILKMLDHPNILTFKESHTDLRHFYIVSELCEGGDLHERMTDQNCYIDEKQASQLVKTMLLTIQYLHENQIVHRDIKPENFVFKSKDLDSSIVLIDFGCALIVSNNVRYRNVFGTPHYLAPEVVAGRKCARTGRILKFSDVWSIGIIAYVLVTGQIPFSGSSTKGIFESILRKPLIFPKNGENLSKSFIDFCERVLTKSPHERLPIGEALNHPWMKERETSEKKAKGEVVRRRSSRTESSDGSMAIVCSLASKDYVYRVESGLFILGSGLEDVCEGIPV